jgi:hypothetical protein
MYNPEHLNVLLLGEGFASNTNNRNHILRYTTIQQQLNIIFYLKIKNEKVYLYIYY